MDDLAVGYGIKGAAAVALERLGRPFEGARLAIEGFGKAGAGTARACGDAGARVVAVSTVEGVLVDPRGLDVDDLLALRAQHGDAFVHHGPVPVQPREALFAVECDVLVPGARPHVISPESVTELRCAAVVPTANVPYATGATDALAAAGILALPDFVTNAGGIHLYEAPECQEDPARCLAAVERLVGETTRRVLAAADADHVTPDAGGSRDRPRLPPDGRRLGRREVLAHARNDLPGEALELGRVVVARPEHKGVEAELEGEAGQGLDPVRGRALEERLGQALRTRAGGSCGASCVGLGAGRADACERGRQLDYTTALIGTASGPTRGSWGRSRLLRSRDVRAGRTRAR